MCFLCRKTPSLCYYRREVFVVLDAAVMRAIDVAINKKRPVNVRDGLLGGAADLSI